MLHVSRASDAHTHAVSSCAAVVVRRLVVVGMPTVSQRGRVVSWSGEIRICDAAYAEVLVDSGSMRTDTSVREMVRAIQAEVRDTDLSPVRASEVLMRLTALLGNVLEEIREADQEYATTLLECLSAHDKANRARIVAETSPQYRRRQEARNTRELIQEMVRSLKVFIRAQSEEMKLTHG